VNRSSLTSSRGWWNVQIDDWFNDQSCVVENVRTEQSNTVKRTDMLILGSQRICGGECESEGVTTASSFETRVP
jgi:hypothetical protein